MADSDNIAIGRLRWPVQIVTRAQAPQPGGTGINEPYVAPQFARADVQSVGALTFWGLSGEQTDTPITHRIFMRWVNYVTNADAILRTTILPDGSQRTETFRVRRIKEIGGRKRFVILECELEVSR